MLHIIGMVCVSFLIVVLMAAIEEYKYSLDEDEEDDYFYNMD